MSRISVTTDALVRLYRRSGLTMRGLIALVAAVLTLGSALVVLAVTSEDVLGHNGLATDDPGWLRFVTDHRFGWLVDIARVLAEAGSVAVLGIAAVAVAGLLWWRGTRVALAIAPGLALGVAGACAAVGKAIVHRSRPPVSLRLISEGEASFPSGHTTDSTALLVALALVLAVAVLRSHRATALIVSGAMLLAGLIGASRLELGVHWPTDVIAGYALGLVVAVAVTTAAVFVSRMAPPSEGSDARLRRFRAVLSAQRHPTALNTTAA